MRSAQRLETAGSPVRVVSDPKAAADERVKGGYIWGVLRLGMGWIFFWPFLDKLLALGFSTGRNPETGAIDFFGDAAWINGGSPTEGFLRFGMRTKEPFLGFYQGLADVAWLEWVFMLSLAAIGLALLVGIGVRPAAIGGAAWMAIFWTATGIWPEHNPFLDDHLVYLAILVGLAWVGAGRWLGLGTWWRKTSLVQRFPILE